MSKHSQEEITSARRAMKSLMKMKKKRDAEEKLKYQDTPTAVTRRNQLLYIGENGAREDRNFRTNREEWNNDVNEMVSNNMMRGYKRGIKYRDYPLDRAVKRSKERRNGK